MMEPFFGLKMKQLYKILRICWYVICFDICNFFYILNPIIITYPLIYANFWQLYIKLYVQLYNLHVRINNLQTIIYMVKICNNITQVAIICTILQFPRTYKQLTIIIYTFIPFATIYTQLKIVCTILQFTVFKSNLRILYIHFYNCNYIFLQFVIIHIYIGTIFF